MLSVWLGAGSVAQAQEQAIDWRTFWPIATGDEWVYHEAGGSCASHWGGGGCSSWGYERTYRAVRDTVVEGASIHVIRGPGGEALLGATADGSGLIHRRLSTDSSGPALPPFPYHLLGTVSRQQPQPAVVSIGGTDYDVRVIRVYDSLVGEGLGLLKESYRGNGSGGSSWWGSTTLVYARIGGDTYGTDPANAVASERGPEKGGAVLAFPNPVRQGTLLRYDLPASGIVRVEAVDMLGRVVWERPPVAQEAGRTVTPVSLAHVPPGTYVLRVVADGDLVGTATVMRLAD